MARAAAAEAFSRRLGAAVRGLSGAWYSRHMAAADRAIRARLPLVDLVLEVRDARVSSPPPPPSFLFPSPPFRRDGIRLTTHKLVDSPSPSQVPATSAFELLHRRSPEEPDVRRLVALNKADLADPSETEVTNSRTPHSARARFQLLGALQICLVLTYASCLLTV